MADADKGAFDECMESIRGTVQVLQYSEHPLTVGRLRRAYVDEGGWTERTFSDALRTLRRRGRVVKGTSGRLLPGRSR